MKAAALALALATGCTALGDGDVLVLADGEQGAREGFPFAAGEGEVAFADGWSVRFDTYLVAVGDLEVAASDGEDGAASDAIYVFDLTEEDPELDLLVGLPARRWDRFSFAVRPPADEEPVRRSGGASEDDAARLRDGGWNYLVEGTATKADRTVTFSWGLSNPVRARDCTNGSDGTQGIVVRANATAEAEITFHVEHMFWDTLGSEQTRLRFDAIAAMADADGVVAWEALADQRLADLRDEDGEPLRDADGSAVVYDPGSAGLPSNDLQAFILATTRTQAHLNGEGLCSISAL